MAGPLTSMFPVNSQEYFSLNFQQNSANSTDVMYSFYQGTSMLLSGKNERVLTSLLQQSAVTYSSKSLRTLYIRPRKHDQLPMTVHGMVKMSYSTMQYVQYMYMTHVEQFIDYFISLDNSKVSPPQAVIIEELDAYVRQINECSHVAIVKLCGLIMDSINYLQKRYNKPVPLLISVTDTLKNHLLTYGVYMRAVLLLDRGNIPKKFYLVENERSGRLKLNHVKADSEKTGVVQFALSVKENSISLDQVCLLVSKPVGTT